MTTDSSRARGVARERASSWARQRGRRGSARARRRGNSTSDGRLPRAAATRELWRPRWLARRGCAGCTRGRCVCMFHYRVKRVTQASFQRALNASCSISTVRPRGTRPLLQHPGLEPVTQPLPGLEEVQARLRALAQASLLQQAVKHNPRATRRFPQGHVSAPDCARPLPVGGGAVFSPQVPPSACLPGLPHGSSSRDRGWPACAGVADRLVSPQCGRHAGRRH